MGKNYFCYSSALDTQALEIWKSQHGYPDFKLEVGELVSISGYKLVFNFASRFWGGRVAGLQASANPTDKVFGILFSIPENLWTAVEHKEGVMTGVSIPLSVTVKKSDSTIVEAVAFTTNPARETTDGPLSRSFLDVIAKAYAQWKLPPESLAQVSKELATLS